MRERFGKCRICLIVIVIAAGLFSCVRAQAKVEQKKYAGEVDYLSSTFAVRDYENSTAKPPFDIVPNSGSAIDGTNYVDFGGFDVNLAEGSPDVYIFRVNAYVKSVCSMTADNTVLAFWDEDSGEWTDYQSGFVVGTSYSKRGKTITSPYLKARNQINNMKVRVATSNCATGSALYDKFMITITPVSGGTATDYPATTITSHNGAGLLADGKYIGVAATSTVSGEEYNYLEMTDFGFDVTGGAALSSVSSEFVWKWSTCVTGSTLTSANLQVWDEGAGSWVDNAISPIPTAGTAATSTIDLISYISASDLNSLKFRFRGAAGGVASPCVGISVDTMSVSVVRAFAASDMALVATDTAAFRAGDTDRVALSFLVPNDDTASETVGEVYVINTGTAVDTTDIESVRLCVDSDSDYGLDAGEVASCVAMTYDSGTSRWGVTGQSITVPTGGKRFLVVVDVSDNPTDAATVIMAVAEEGVVFSPDTFGGPTGSDAVSPGTQTIDGMIASQITNTGAPGGTVYAGQSDFPVMDITIPSNGVSSQTLTGLRVKNAGTAVDSYEISAVKAWAESGATAGFQAAQDTLLGTLAWDSGNGWWANTGLSQSSIGRVYITADIGTEAAYGKTIRMYLPAGSSDTTAGIVVATSNDGPVDSEIYNAATATTDTIYAAQITNTGAPDATIVSSDTNLLVMNFVAPGNGASGDTLQRIRVANTGTAVNSTDISAVKIWTDTDGDGSFEPDGDDSGGLIGTASWNAGTSLWETATVSVTIPSGGKRIFVSIDISSDPTIGATVNMSLSRRVSTDATAGLVMESGGVGPRDSAVTNTGTQSVKSSLTVSFVSKAATTAYTGSTGNTMIQLLMRPQTAMTLSEITAALTGTAVASDISAAKLWHDVNDSGEWDPGDVQISTTKTFSGTTLTFDAIAYSLTGGATDSLIITYNYSTAGDSHTAGVSITATGSVTTTVPAANVIVFATTPITSSTTTLKSSITITGTDIAPGTLPAGTDKAGLLLLTVGPSVSASDFNITSIAVDLLGTAQAIDGSPIYFYHDANDSGSWDSGDELIDTQDFSDGSLTFSFANCANSGGSCPSAELCACGNAAGLITVAPGETQKMLIVADIPGLAIKGHTLGVSIAATSSITLSGTTTEISASMPFQSSTPAITRDEIAYVWKKTSDTSASFYGGGAPSRISGTPVLYIGDDDGKLYCITLSNGSVRWSYSAHDAIRSLPYIRNSSIFFGDESGYVYVLDSSGNLTQSDRVSNSAIRTSFVRWNRSTGSEQYEERIYFGGLDGKVYCRVGTSISTTCENWTDTNLGSPVYATPVQPYDNYIYVGTAGSVVKIDRMTGTVSASYNISGTVYASPFVWPMNTRWPADGAWIWVASSNGYVYKIDTTKAPGGDKVWASPYHISAGVNNSVMVNVFGDMTVYVGGNDGRLYALNNTDGSLKWKFPDASSPAIPGEIQSCPMYDPNSGKVYFGSNDNRAYAVTDNTTSGALVAGWPHTTSADITACPSIFDNYIIFSSQDGDIKAFAR